MQRVLSLNGTQKLELTYRWESDVIVHHPEELGGLSPEKD